MPEQKEAWVSALEVPKEDRATFDPLRGLDASPNFEMNTRGILDWGKVLAERASRLLNLWNCNRLASDALELSLGPARAPALTEHLDRLFAHYLGWCAALREVEHHHAQTIFNVQRMQSLRSTIDDLLREARSRAMELESRVSSLRLMDKAEQIADQLVQRGRIEVGRELVDLIERIERNTGTAAATAAVAEADFKRLLEQHRELELAGKDALERLAAEVRGQLQKQGPLSETRKSVIEDLAVKAGGGFLAAALKQLLLGP